MKPGEVAHDAAIYRMYQAEARQIERQGGRIGRIVLDYELKRQVYTVLAKATDLEPFAYAKLQAEVAQENGLKVVQGKIRFPDLRIEYETASGEASRVAMVHSDPVTLVRKRLGDGTADAPGRAGDQDCPSAHPNDPSP